MLARTRALVVRSCQGLLLDELGGDLFHSGLGLALLIVIQVLNVFKPRGMTSYAAQAE